MCSEAGSRESKFRQLLDLQVERVRRFSTARSGLVLAPPLSREFVGALLVRQRGYLLWAVFLSVHQVLEIFLMAKTHFVYFSPGSLLLLRVLSSVTLCGVIASVAVRRISAEMRLHRDGSDFSAPIWIQWIAKVVFTVTAIVSLILSLVVAMNVTLQVTTPPMFRAMVVSGIIALPFDSLTTFLLYNRISLRAPPPTIRLRFWFWSSNICALVAICTPWPLLYLGIKIVPRVMTSLYLWVRFTHSGVRELLLAHFTFPERGRWHREVVARLKPALLLLLAGELSFYLVTNPLVRMFEWSGLVVYFAHKMIHTSAVISFKGAALLVRVRLLAQRLCDRALARSSGFKLAALIAFASLVSSAILPPLLMKQQLLRWATPTGEFDPFDARYIPAVLLFTAAHTAFLVYGVLGAVERASFRRVSAAALAAILLPCGILRILIFVFAGWSSVFFYFVAALTDFLAMVVVLKFMTRLRSRVPLEAITEVLRPSGRAEDGHLIFLRTAYPISDQVLGTVSEHFDLSETQSRKLVWSRRTLFGVVPSSDEVDVRSMAEDLVVRFGSEIAEIRWASRSGRSSFEGIQELFRSDLHFGDRLFSSFTSRRCPKRLLSSLARAEFDRIVSGQEPSDPGITVFRRSKDGWKLNARPESQSENVLYYLEATTAEDTGALFTHVRARHFQGFFHLNRGGVPEIVGYVDVDRRSDLLFDLRRAAFSANLRDLCALADDRRGVA